MSLNPALVSAYRFHRARSARLYGRPVPLVAREALEQARIDASKGIARYPHDGKATPAVCWQTRDESKPRYRAERLGFVQSIEGAGLRHVGDVTAEERGGRDLWNNRSEKSGWLTDPYGDYAKDGTGLCWGVVYQLPARDGKARFVAGYIFGGCSDDLPTVEFGEIHCEDARGGYNDSPQEYDAARTAARAADSMAQRAAEEEREYQSAYGAGSRYADLGEQAATARKAALAILKERHAVKGMGAYPALCEAIRAKVADYRRDIEQARNERAALASGDGERSSRETYLAFWSGDTRLRQAFNEGAGAAVL